MSPWPDNAERRFFRRDHTEMAVIRLMWMDPDYLDAIHIFDRMTRDPEVADLSLVPIDGFNNYWQDFNSSPVVRGEVAVAHGEVAERVTAAVALFHHRGSGGTPVAVGLKYRDDLDTAALVAQVRKCDAEKLQGLVDWLTGLRWQENPRQGTVSTFDQCGRLVFAPPYHLEREDVVLPPQVFDDLNRHFAFLRDSDGLPKRLRHRGVVLWGSPGVGKTILARWFAANCGATALWFDSTNLSAGALRFALHKAMDLRPSLIVLDDVVSQDEGVLDPEVMSEFLSNLDGFFDLENIGILVTTRSVEILGKALHPVVRPGRFHRAIKLDLPDSALRSAMVSRLLHRSPLPPECRAEVARKILAAGEGCCGANLAEFVRELVLRVAWAEKHDEPADPEALVEQVLSGTALRRELGFR